MSCSTGSNNVFVWFQNLTTIHLEFHLRRLHQIHHYYRIQWLLRFHPVERPGFYHRLRRHPDLFRALFRLEDYQEDENNQVTRRRYLFW